MISSPSKLDPDTEAYKKRAAMKSFDPKRRSQINDSNHFQLFHQKEQILIHFTVFIVIVMPSSVLLVLKEEEIRGFGQNSFQVKHQCVHYKMLLIQ